LSFDVFLQRFHLGELAEADRLGVAEVLRELEATGPDDLGYYHVVVNDVWEIVRNHSGPVTELEIVHGSESRSSPARHPFQLRISAVDLDGDDEFTGCAFFLHALSPGIAEVIFRIAEAGGMAIIPAAPIGPLLPPSAEPDDLPAVLSHPHRIESGRQLFSALSGEYGYFQRWRDRVTPVAARRASLLRRLATRIGRGRR